MIEQRRPFLSGDEIEALFQLELKTELTKIVADAYLNDSYSPYVAKHARVVSESYQIAKRPDRPLKLNPDDEADLLARGFDPIEFDFIEQDLAERCYTDDMSNADIADRLAKIGVALPEEQLESVRSHMLRARADAWRRAMRVFDRDIVDAANPIAALMCDGAAKVAVARSGLGTAPQATSPDCPFVNYDTRRFSEVIDQVIAELQVDNVWKGDGKQQRRILQTFAWITGDKALGAYDHNDVAQFKTGLSRLPTTFRFGTLDKGPMSRPFAEVMAELAPFENDEKRNPKTTKRDLYTLSTVAKRLALTSWKPRMHGVSIMDFDHAAKSIKMKTENLENPLRPAWTKEHIECLFQSPIFTGGGGAKRRLKTDPGRNLVWHDAAYWAPLLWYYHQACREEICGLRVDEVVTEHSVPHFYIKDPIFTLRITISVAETANLPARRGLRGNEKFPSIPSCSSSAS